MPPRRPPPLPQGLFAPQGPLAPDTSPSALGSAPLPPSPNTVHPSFVVDSHTFNEQSGGPSGDIFAGLPAEVQRPQVRGVVKVDLSVGAVPAPYDGTTIHPLILDLSSTGPSKLSVTPSKTPGTVDIILPATQPLTESQWDLLEEIVSKLDGGWGEEQTAEGTNDRITIVISGLLPPSLTKPSSPLLNDEIYGLHLARLASLSLHSDVYLKALPPVVDVPHGTSSEDGWWNDKKETERVLRMYVSPAIETFGTHRLIFGSSPALPQDQLPRLTKSGTFEHPIASEEWYAILRKVVTELGEGQEATTDVMGQNAVKVYRL